MQFEGGATGLTDPLLLAWIETAGRAVAAYYGVFPVNEALVRIRHVDGRGISNGVATSEDLPTVTIELGRQSSPSDLANDWVLTHELVHLAFPSVPPRHHWIEEGIATYVEPIARVRIGALPVESFWHDFVRDLPQGLPEPGDAGLDNTPTWGRTYWGGALFCFLADIRMREATRGARGLEDALRGIVAAGGRIDETWSLERALAAGDRATGTSVLVSLYERMKDKPEPVDLVALWKSLGVAIDGDTVSLDERAPRAWLRHALAASPTGGGLQVR